MSERREETQRWRAGAWSCIFARKIPANGTFEVSHVCVKNGRRSKKHSIQSRDTSACRTVGDHTVIAILETGASLADVEVAVIHARGEGEYDVTGHTLSGTAALIAGILLKDELYAQDEDR